MALVVTCKYGEGVRVGNATVILLQGHGGGARLHITAAPDVPIVRGIKFPPVDRFSPEPENGAKVRT